jgi:hypothetical protein
VTPAELEAEVEKAREFDHPLAHFILATTGPSDAHVQEAARLLTDQHRDKGLFCVDVMFWPDFLALYDIHIRVFWRHYGQLILTWIHLLNEPMQLLLAASHWKHLHHKLQDITNRISALTGDLLVDDAPHALRTMERIWLHQCWFLCNEICRMKWIPPIPAMADQNEHEAANQRVEAIQREAEKFSLQVRACETAQHLEEKKRDIMLQLHSLERELGQGLAFVDNRLHGTIAKIDASLESVRSNTLA